MDFFEADFGTGIYFNGTPIVCEELNCATYSFSDAQWTLGPNPIINRDGARAALLEDNQMWLTGGREVATSEVLIDGFFQPGPALPIDTFLHCLVRVNQTHYLMIGGRSDDSSTEKVFFFDWPNQVWTQVQGMSVPRDLHSCALLTGINGVIAMGGYETKAYYSTSEIFDLDTETWSLGPNLPRDSYFSGSQAVPYMGSVLLIGGKQENDGGQLLQKEIHQLDLETMEWVKRPEELKTGRFDHIAFPIPLGSCNAK